MNTSSGRIVTACVLCLAQILLCNYLYLSQYVVVNILPLVILSLPSRRNAVFAMSMAFIIGLAVDFASTGLLGLTSAALLLPALLRLSVLRIVDGDEAFLHRDSAPIGHLTIRAVFFTTLIMAVLFFLPYVFIDAAGTRPIWFNLSRMALSSVLSAAVMTFINGFVYVEK